MSILRLWHSWRRPVELVAVVMAVGLLVGCRGPEVAVTQVGAGVPRETARVLNILGDKATVPTRTEGESADNNTRPPA